ncbi:hypothetical protein ACFXP3_36075 [Streptomyces sp. NPDC059096]|uniref:hypothetical protein n=1 Tax=Streptomyces sp. NPDC059096 TaxID=3346727 RepID=UPI0036CABA72
MWLAVSTLTVLETALELSDPAAVATAVIERHGPYVCWFDADTTGAEGFTETGDWVGTAPEHPDLGTLIETFERRQATDGE